jgi:hypothetical protein
MADALSFGATYSRPEGGRVPSPGCRRPPFSILAALYPHPPRARLSLCPTPIAYAAATSEDVTRSPLCQWQTNVCGTDRARVSFGVSRPFRIEPCLPRRA